MSVTLEWLYCIQWVGAPAPGLAIGYFLLT